MKYTPLSNRSLLRLTGKDCFELLQNLVSNDLKPTNEGKAVYSALLTPQGKFLHDFFVIAWKDALYLDVLAERKDDLIRRLTMYKLRADMTIEDVSGSYQVYALFEGTPEKTDDNKQFLYPDPRLPQLGWRLIAENGSQPASIATAEKVTLEDYTAHRLALGVPEGGTDIVPEKNFLLEVNFEELHGVSFSKGCYVGQELTNRTKFRAKIRKRLLSFTYDGDLSIGDGIFLDGKEIATVTTFQKPHGLALTRLEAWRKIEAENPTLEPAGLVLAKPEYVVLPELEDEKD
ncbi:YgfZ/GcvT domain-containing protein [Sneathiella limimaris]|uniref:CAF17-like 4Fe-4S cluster assembly/insertion protein YgfZ n=1 Tax=Sneathiella limimaris TaxID=1964213 RepID=UPI00146D14C7|nr:folate-binding protein YgfZ [Sneathiella limimaris]